MTDESPTASLDRYRKRIDFDDTANLSHPVDCYPDSCPIVGYLQDGELRYQEQNGRLPVVDPETPDWNPRGCSRQCSFTDATYGEERIEQPMKQTGERGSDGWEPISWEEAYEEIAEAMIDAIEDNPQSIVAEQPPLNGGNVHGVIPVGVLMNQVGGVYIDMNALVGDCFLGQNLTFGKMHYCSTHDDWFNSELIIVWHANPAYSRNPSYHFLTEARYGGGELVTIAPDHSPSAIHADRYVPVEPASDAALCLGIARVIVEEDLADWAFVKEQTDLPLLVREDTDRFLREEDLEPEGSDERFYVWDPDEGLAPAPRETLELGDLDPAMEGTFEVEIDGEAVAVRPVFDRLRETLEAEYDLETVREITGVHPDVVEELARKIATHRTSILNSFNLGKTFHGDLIERGMALVLGLTGNWGREGTGMRGWGAFGEATAGSGTSSPILEQAAEQTAERALTDEEIARKARNSMLRLAPGLTVPAAFWWYRHCGYDEIWDEGVEDYPREVSNYIEEAVEKGWWEGLDMPKADVEPNQLFLVGSNTLRRTRGGTRVLLEELWPKLDQIVTVDYRWSTTALYSDIVLPAAFHHEKEQFDSMVTSEMRFLAYSDKAIEPRHDSKSELEMVAGIVRKVEELAAERGLETYDVPHGMTADRFNELLNLAETDIGEIDALPEGMRRSNGPERSYGDLYERVLERQLDVEGGDDAPVTLTDDHVTGVLEAIVERCVDADLFEEETTLSEIKDRGFAKYEGLGETLAGINQAADVEPDEPLTALDLHVEEKKPFPSLTGRAQFYIDHEWFLEADEALPGYKSPPADHGGDRETYPFFITSGHNRHSTQAATLASDVQMNQHRGEPHLFVNREAAAEKGIEDGDDVRVFNDYDEFTVQAKVSSQPRPDQVIIYHAWDEYLFPGGKGHHRLTPGVVKPLHFAGDYGHLEYHTMNWEPTMYDRHVSVDIEPVE